MKIKFFIAFLSIIILLPLNSFADKAYKLNKQGIEAYNQKRNEDSLKSFTDALVERPGSPELLFNMGTALSASGKKKEAADELEKAASGFNDNKLKATARFNAGNAMMGAGDFNSAVNEYKQAVKLDQSSGDIKHNLEIALKKLREQQKQQQQQQQNKDNKDNKNNKDKKDNKQDNKKDNKQNQQQQQQQNKNTEQNQSPQQQDKQAMSPEEAKRILDAISDEEKKAIQLKKKMMQQEMRQGDDW
jgi:Ca-activated chloride channel homolog